MRKEERKKAETRFLKEAQQQEMQEAEKVVPETILQRQPDLTMTMR